MIKLTINIIHFIYFSGVRGPGRRLVPAVVGRRPERRRRAKADAVLHEGGCGLSLLPKIVYIIYILY